MRRFRTLALVCTTLVPLTACDDDEDLAGDTDGEDTGTVSMLCFEDAMIPGHADPSCGAVPDYYAPGTPDWPACAMDGGEYPLIDSTPSSIARVEAYEEMMGVMRFGTAPTPDDFTAARAIYAVDEGLESRLQRREDLRVVAVPMADWAPGVDSDKQCSVTTNVDKYPERCVGPSTLAPMINEAFMMGQTGQGDPRVLAARIDGAILWFLYISTIKEANTCFTSKAKDCDSSWAYYTGGTNRQGGIGLSGAVTAVDPAANDAVWNGFGAFRCLREIEPADEDPSLEDLTIDGMMKFVAANEQLEAALAYAGARMVRAEAEQLSMSCDMATAARWEFVRTFANALAPSAEANDAGAWATAQAIIDNPEPTEADLATLVSIVDTLFPCP